MITKYKTAAFNESFRQCLESIQYNIAIALTEAIRGRSSEKLLQELGLETLKSIRCFQIPFSNVKTNFLKIPFSQQL